MRDSVMSLASVYATMTIAIAISCLLLVTLVVAQLCLSAVNSVRSVVNRNLALSFALSILVFLVGIRVSQRSMKTRLRKTREYSKSFIRRGDLFHGYLKLLRA